MARTIYTRIVFDDSVESVVEPAKTDLWLNDYRENGYESGDLNPATIGSGTYPLFTTDGYHGYVESGSAYPDEKTVTYNGNILTFKFYGNNGGISSLTIILNGSYIFNRSLGYSSASCGALWFVYDDELEQINILWSCGGNFYGRHYTSDCGAIQSVASSAIIKSILDHFVIPTYNWRSVSLISGKNGILSLSTINDSAINNGDPVTGATSDTFHSTEDSKIEELVTYATPIDSSKSESFTCVYQATPPFDALKLLVKKNSAPQDEEDADLVVNLPNPALSTGIDEYTATNLDPLTNYFCVVQVSDSGGHYKYSDPAEVRTGFMDRNFDYTGSIQTFTAPKTGIYSLETWGAQGGDATDGTNSARGGYGAYAYGEVLLQQGETIYINVGGQNGYGGGGGMSLEIPLGTIVKNLDMSHYKSASGWSALDNLSQWYGTDWNLFGELENCSNPQATKSDTEYYLNAGDNRLGGGCMRYAFALNSTYKISKIECDIKMMGTLNSEYYTVQVECRKSSASALVFNGMLGVAHNSSAGSMDYNVTDNDYHTYVKEFSTPIELDYLVLYQAYYPAYFKNIKLTIV